MLGSFALNNLVGFIYDKVALILSYEYPDTDVCDVNYT